MHFDFLPKVTHNEDAVREYERRQSERIRRRLVRILAILPVIVLLAWLYLRFR